MQHHRFVRSSIRHTQLVGVIAILGIVACSDDNPMDPENNPPIALFTADPLSVPTGDNHTTVITVDASSSTDPDGDAITYSWSAMSAQFVDGTTSTSQIARITFPGAAPYDVVLRVTDGRGGEDTTTITISLDP